MDISPTWAFRLLLFVLVGTSVFFTVSVEMQRAAIRGSAQRAQLEAGSDIRIESVIDGDELTASHGDKTFTVRLVGIKAFAPLNEPGPGNAGIRAREYLEAYVGKLGTIEFAELAIDKNDRLLAYVHVDGVDVGEKMVRDGRVMVFTRYAFDRQQSYLATELEAQTAKRGMWASERVMNRAAAMRAAWSEEAKK